MNDLSSLTIKILNGKNVISNKGVNYIGNWIDEQSTCLEKLCINISDENTIHDLDFSSKEFKNFVKAIAKCRNVTSLDLTFGKKRMANSNKSIKRIGKILPELK